MTLHYLCLALLNHEITQALTCGKALNYSSSKDLILIFGALHFFVISGAHLNFLKKILHFLKLPKFLEITALSFFVIICNFSAPVTRSFIQYLLEIQKKLYIPKELSPLCSYIFCLPIALLFLNSLVSLGLSFLFGSIISTLPKKSSSYLLVYSIALPVFLSTLGLPHYSSFLILPFINLLIFIMLPLSLLSVFSNIIEAATIKVWWLLESSLNYLHIFYNFPQKPQSNFHLFTSLNLFIYGFLIILISYMSGVFWKRSSYSL